MSEVNTQQITTQQQDSTAHDAAMAAKFDAGTGNEPAVNNEPPADGTGTNDTPADRPEWLPEKFKTVEDFVKSHAELEKKLGQPKDDEGQNQEPTDDATKAAKEAVESKGLDFTSMSNEYWQNGELSDATYEALEKGGIPREVVDQFITGQEAVVERLQSKAFAIAGGEDQYNALNAWAATNWSEDQIQAYNQAVNSNKADVISNAVMGLKAAYDAANGSEPNLINGDTNDGVGPVYETWAQVTEAMRDPRYAKDAAYRRQVEAQLARSTPH